MAGVKYAVGVDVDRLKIRSPSSPVLDMLMRQACAELELVSVVSAARIGSETSHGKSVGSAPKGSRNGYIDVLRERYMEATCNWDRLKCIADAQHELQLVRGNRARTYRDGRRRHSSAWKQAVANDTRSSSVVARDFGCSAVYVRKLRMQYRSAGVDPV